MNKDSNTSDKIVRIGRSCIRAIMKEAQNGQLDAGDLCGARHYGYSPNRVDARGTQKSMAGNCTPKPGEATLKRPKLQQQMFESAAIIKRYRHRASAIEESLINTYLSGVSVRCVEDITETPWGTRVSSDTERNLNQKAYKCIEVWCNRPIKDEYPYVYLAGIEKMELESQAIA